MLLSLCLSLTNIVKSVFITFRYWVGLPWLS